MTALEEQLVDLDQQHQTALEVAVNNRDQLKEDNRQLQLQLLQLVNDRQQEQQVQLLLCPSCWFKRVICVV